MQNIQALEKIARTLDPEGEERSSVWKKVLDYAKQFLDELPHYPGFVSGSFDKLSSLEIEEQGKPVETILEVLLVDFFLKNLREIYNRPVLTLTREAAKWLQQLAQPGNFRQLKNLVERTVLVSRGDVLDAADFQAQYDPSPVKQGSLPLPGVGMLTLEEVEMIKRAMAFHKNKIAKAAVALDLTRSALYRRLEKYNLPYDETAD